MSKNKLPQEYHSSPEGYIITTTV